MKQGNKNNEKYLETKREALVGEIIGNIKCFILLRGWSKLINVTDEYCLRNDDGMLRVSNKNKRISCKSYLINF